MRVECYFNDTENGQNARKLVLHGDINALSIYANQLKEQAKTVLHGMIREVSLVYAGANPGAFIDSVVVHQFSSYISNSKMGIKKTADITSTAAGQAAVKFWSTDPPCSHTNCYSQRCYR